MNFYKLNKIMMEQRQMSFFQARARELYHGSNSGPNDSIAQSFMKNGAQSGMAGGFQQATSSKSQGAGFYVWSDAANAKNHSTKEAGEGGSETKMGGSPMIVVVESVLEPEEWDLDYETNSHTVAKWLHNNWDTVKDDLGEVLNLDKTKGPLPKPEGSEGLHLAWPSQGPGMGGKRSTIAASGHKDDSYSGTNVALGEKLGIIMNALSTGKNNALMHKFEERFFANMPAGVGVKYTGANTLAVKRIEILKDGQWVDFSTH